MSKAGSSPDNPIDNKTGWVARQIERYLATDGREPRAFGGAPLLLLTTKGRRSGDWHRTALISGENDGRYLVVASLGGSPKHPAWYLNLEANPEVHVQVGEKTFRAVARTATAEEKPELWAQMVGIYHSYASYQKRTKREIPVVILEPLAD